jgi:hypothetical protein
VVVTIWKTIVEEEGHMKDVVKLCSKCFYFLFVIFLEVCCRVWWEEDVGTKNHGLREGMHELS